MTLSQIKTVVHYSKDYWFLSENPSLGGNIMLLGLGGSHAYGTATPNSDLDIRGIAMPSRSDLLLQKDFEQVVDEKTDTTIYSLKKMVKLLKGSNPNILELIGLEPWQYLYLSEAGELLVKNKDLFLSQGIIKTFAGYADQQLYRLRQLSSHSFDVDELERHVMKVINRVHETFPEQYESYNGGTLDLYIGKSKRKDMSDEILMDVSLKGYPLRDYCEQWNTLQNIVRSYNKVGKRNLYAVEHKKISKHMMHLIRLDMMCLDLLREGKLVVYREKDISLLMDIRSGKYVKDGNVVSKEFYDIVEDFNSQIEEAKLHTVLPPKIDCEKVDKLVINLVESIL